MPTTALEALRLHLAEALTVRKLIVEGGGGGSIEAISPLDLKALLLVKTPPKNMLSYFGRAPSSVRASPSPSPSPSSSGMKRQAAAAVQGVAAAGFGSSHGGGGVGRKRNKSGGAFGKGGKGSAGSVAEGAAALFGSPKRPVIAAGGAAALFGSHTRAVTPGSGGGGGGGGGGRSGGEAEVVALTAVNSGAPEVIAIDD